MANTPPDDDNKPNTEERYGTATKSSNLRFDVREDSPTGATGMLIAAGWSQSRLGASLMRLHSEWEGAEHPKRQGHDAIKLLASTFKQDADGMVQFDKDTRLKPLSAAQRTAHDWYMHELKLLFQKLKTMPEVRQQLVLWARLKQIADADQRVAEILAWWLDHVCPVCDGLGKDKIPGTPSLSHKACKACNGTGETRIPAKFDNSGYQRESKMLLRYIHDCLKAATVSIRQRLQPMRAKKKEEERL